eukprot:CAMPEP_0174298366 /NCGR_PEP_ID=MMETSP0809-20121228/53525_1 /TAXON_ID=73025 ORGANISM="Eutreptiella gymnastica-like, Strain CCMP1594" /NCGR_SAMPLE_ID=MMETSP0809 /ASSEMBLY_ACC=CAM_ASM_000658 /LENGTH=151 /DNA_ID=CAMNT_0015402765 /DNA_START=434 /DNA_END=889 /DNA_ORIENTATION=-
MEHQRLKGARQMVRGCWGWGAAQKGLHLRGAACVFELMPWHHQLDTADWDHTLKPQDHPGLGNVEGIRLQQRTGGHAPPGNAYFEHIMLKIGVQRQDKLLCTGAFQHQRAAVAVEGGGELHGEVLGRGRGHNIAAQWWGCSRDHGGGGRGA